MFPWTVFHQSDSANFVEGLEHFNGWRSQLRLFRVCLSYLAPLPNFESLTKAGEGTESTESLTVKVIIVKTHGCPSDSGFAPPCRMITDKKSWSIIILSGHHAAVSDRARKDEPLHSRSDGKLVTSSAVKVLIKQLLDTNPPGVGPDTPGSHMLIPLRCIMLLSLGSFVIFSCLMFFVLKEAYKLLGYESIHTIVCKVCMRPQA